MKGHKKTSKSPALAGCNCLCGLRRPLEGLGSPVFEVDLYGDAAPNLDSCQNATPLSLRRVDRQGSLVPQRSGGANLPVPESPTTAATCEAGCGPDHDPGGAGFHGAKGGGRGRQANSGLNPPSHHFRSQQQSCPTQPAGGATAVTGNSSEKDPWLSRFREVAISRDGVDRTTAILRTTVPEA